MNSTNNPCATINLSFITNCVFILVARNSSFPFLCRTTPRTEVIVTFSLQNCYRWELNGSNLFHEPSSLPSSPWMRVVNSFGKFF
ncbi:hypothetical protein MKW98_019714 [Papaver atlanticum]|uniref:Uncharacterized protein n=1 Tax=Papaver atlanticum TaxID=357466 RepID=A0AAD4XTJ5_9MAGN|nr:hypothetical protein MKW98_019714 [Papaver atlanticum]